jgi:hypothetical protein
VVVESDLRSRCRTSKELGRALSPCDARPYPGKGCGQGLRELGLLKVLSEPAAAGTIGRRSACDTQSATSRGSSQGHVCFAANYSSNTTSDA